VAHHLRPHFACCLTEISAGTLDLGHTFDVVLAHDAVDYMTSRTTWNGSATRRGGTSSRVAVHYSFLLRDRDGGVRALYERHECGLFPQATRTRVLEARGFGVDVVVERTDDDRTPRRVFLGHKPPETSGSTTS
jgi:hypothetical protein